METIEPGWIGSRKYDLFFFFGSSALAMLLGVVLLYHPAWIVLCWWGWLLLLDGPHLFSTWTRAYTDPRDREKLGKILFGSLLIFLPGLVLLYLSIISKKKDPFDLFLLIASLWSWHHFVRQHFGLMSVYQWHAKPTKFIRNLDKYFLHASLWLIYGLFVFGHPMNRKILSLPEAATAELRYVLYGMLVLLSVGLLFYLYSIFWRHRQGIGIKPALFILLPVLAAQSFGFFVIGAFEPLVPNPIDPELAFMVVSIMGGMVHSLQYLGLIFVVNRRRYTSSDKGEHNIASWVKTLGRRPSFLYFSIVLLSLGYLVLVAARGISPNFVLLQYNSDWARFFLAIYWGLFFHHYYLDQKIWRPSKDPELRAELGIV